MIMPPPTLKIEVNKEVKKERIAKITINSMDILKCVLFIKDLRLTHVEYRSNH